MSGIGMSGGPGARRLTITVFIACANALTAFDATADAGLLQGLLATIDVAHNMSKYNWVAGENEALLPSVAEWSIRGRPVPADLRSIPIPAIPAIPAFLGPRSSVLGPRSSVTWSRGPFVLSSASFANNVSYDIFDSSAVEGFLPALRRVFSGALLVICSIQSKCLLSASSSVLVVGSILFSAPMAGATVCPHCKDTIAGCLGGTDSGASCPTVANVISNARIFAQHLIEKTPSLTGILTPELCTSFTRPVCDAIVGLACAPARGSSMDLQEMTTGSSPTLVHSGASIVKAACYGHCSIAEANTELNRRIELATSALEVSKLQAGMQSLKLAGETVLSASQGVLQFIWAKVSSVIHVRGGAVHRLEIGNAPKPTALSATLSRPSSQDLYYEMLHYFAMVITALGIANALVVMQFLDKVAHGVVRRAESWKVSCELVLLYLRKIDQDPTHTLSMANVFEHGGQDTMLGEARVNAGAFFRTLGENPRPGAAAGSGNEQQFHSSSKRPCKDYNAGRPCTRLDAQGRCKFNHVCDQWVSDKGKNGICGLCHPRGLGCSYDESKKLKGPATE